MLFNKSKLIWSLSLVDRDKNLQYKLTRPVIASKIIVKKNINLFLSKKLIKNLNKLAVYTKISLNNLYLLLNNDLWKILLTLNRLKQIYKNLKNLPFKFLRNTCNTKVNWLHYL